MLLSIGTGGKIRQELIVANWPDLFRCAATMAAGKMKPSQLLRKLASYPRQNDLAVALRVVGRVERTLFIIEWILDTDMQRRAEIGLNKGEVPPELLAHISPLGWAHILLTGEYLWLKGAKA